MSSYPGSPGGARGVPPADAGDPGGPRPLGRARTRPGEQAVLWLLWLCATISIVTTIGIVAVLVFESIPFFANVDVAAFVTGTEWYPFAEPGTEAFSTGVLPLVKGTLVVTAIALAVAVPLGLAAAVYLSEYAPSKVRQAVKPALEVLAGVPTVVLGYFALTFMTPLLRSLLGAETVQIFNAASAGIVMGFMIVPIVASLSEDALNAVPQALRQGAYALGATKRVAILRVVVPAALSGIVAAVILAMGRALGETMIVTIAAGNLPTMTLDIFAQGQPMTGFIAQTVAGESPRGSVVYQSLFAVGAVLFAMTFLANSVAQWVVRRFRQVY